MKKIFNSTVFSTTVVLVLFSISCKKTPLSSVNNTGKGLATTTSATVSANILDVGTGWPYATLTDAAKVCVPGDTIQIHGGTYTGGDYITNLQGTSSAWITIRAAAGETVLYDGNTDAFQISEATYLRIQGLEFQNQTANGVNLDDGGTLTIAAHNIVVENCTWFNMGGTGNNDELKLSGVDSFTVQNCHFNNGKDGAFVDMVGCHYGVLQDNICQTVGSGGQAFQTKGGSKNIVVQRNRIIDGGDRAMHIGGNTGKQYFRPQGANYEAMNIYVYSNTFKGSKAPIVFSSSVYCEAVNNTIITPINYVIRILQDDKTVQACANNTFRNNICVFTGSTAVNVGPGTNEASFIFSNDLWYNPNNLSWTGPNLPYPEPGQILDKDPQFSDTLYHLQSTSPAIGNGYAVAQPTTDYFALPFKSPRAIGAVEYY